MQQLPTREETEREYLEGYTRVMKFAEYAQTRGWRLSDRQLVHEIVQHEQQPGGILERVLHPVE